MRSIDAEHFLLSIRLAREAIPDPERYPYDLPAVQGLGTLQMHPKVTFLVGENGSGKSTLLEAIAVVAGMNPEGGSQNMRFSTRESHSGLHEALRTSWSPRRRPSTRFFLRAESFYNVATAIEEIDPGLHEAYGGRSLHEQSHGESFMATFLHRFWPDGLYLLDEPEAALSPTRQLAFLTRLHDLVVEGAQFIIATHSPILMAYPDAWIYELSAGGVERIAYEHTDHYCITRQFLQNPEAMMRRLFAAPVEEGDEEP